MGKRSNIVRKDSVNSDQNNKKVSELMKFRAQERGIVCLQKIEKDI